MMIECEFVLFFDEMKKFIFESIESVLSARNKAFEINVGVASLV